MANSNFRKFVLETGREITAGKDSEQNDLLVSSSKPTNIMLHTEEPGSPFVNVGNEPTKQEINQAAVFCAMYSQIWKKKGTNVKVNVFKRCDMNKSRFMKSGSWEVLKYQDSVKVNKLEIQKLENSILT